MGTDDRRNSGRTSEEPGHRRGRNTTFAHPAYSKVPPLQEREPSVGDTRAVPVQEFEDADAFQQHTALFDKGRFLGELADLVDGSPDTRARVEAEAEPPPGFRLITVAGPDLGQIHVFTEDEVVIGRDGNCELPLADIAVSRQHAKIVRDGLHFRLVDLESNNGSFLNGEGVTDSAQLAPGDEVMIGERTFRFVELNELPPEDELDETGRPGSSGSVAPDPAEAGERKASSGAEEEPGSRTPSVDPARGRALRRTSGVVLVGALVLLGLGAAWYGWSARARAVAAEARARQLRIWDLQVVELTRTRRFGDAKILLERLLEADPEHPRRRRYREYAERELQAFQVLRQARAELRQDRYDAARTTLEGVPAQSAYAPDAQMLRQKIERQEARSLVRQAREAMAQGRYGTAEGLVEAAESHLPGVSGTLSDQITRKRPPTPPKPAPARPAKPQVPAGLEPAVELYREGRLTAALDAAAAVATPSAQGWAERLRAMRGRLAALRSAHQAKDGAQILARAPDLRQQETRVGYGKGAVAREIRDMEADGHYLMGVEAQLARDPAGAYRAFRRALGVSPAHAPSLKRLNELAQAAEDTYYRALVAAETDPAQARRLLTEVIQSTSAETQIHRMAARSLSGM